MKAARALALRVASQGRLDELTLAYEEPATVPSSAN
jgi:hypothetical protein